MAIELLFERIKMRLEVRCRNLVVSGPEATA